MILMHMSGAYQPQEFYKDRACIELDCQDVDGTNCYCDDVAKEELRRRVQGMEVEDIHFLDSGNYHYLSLLWLEKIDRPFSLVLFDHHPDMQPPSFGEITSCGGWVKEALEKLDNLKKVYTYGINEELLKEIELDERVEIGLSGLAEDSNDIYISFDKDALSLEDARCDWDQGELRLEDTISLLQDIRSTHTIIGMDVCGEDSKWERAMEVESVIRINNETNRKLYEFWDA